MFFLFFGQHRVNLVRECLAGIFYADVSRPRLLQYICFREHPFLARLAVREDDGIIQGFRINLDIEIPIRINPSLFRTPVRWDAGIHVRLDFIGLPAREEGCECECCFLVFRLCRNGIPEAAVNRCAPFPLRQHGDIAILCDILVF